ncbi:hypothetical protein [Acidianus sp. RZ1]|nr:hypothetical protein [Acidianus sp. RZ1]
MEVEEIKKILADQEDALKELFSGEKIIRRDAENYEKYLITLTPY